MPVGVQIAGRPSEEEAVLRSPRRLRCLRRLPASADFMLLTRARAGDSECPHVENEHQREVVASSAVRPFDSFPRKIPQSAATIGEDRPIA